MNPNALNKTLQRRTTARAMRFALSVIAASCVMALAVQPATAQTADRSQLDPRPYDPATEPDIEMFMGAWQDSPPRHTHGSLIERDILTQGDPSTPTTKGAVLLYASRFTHATLFTGSSTVPTALSGEQEIFYVLTGEGIISGGGVTADLYPGVGALVPQNIEFILTNTGDVPLTMYLLSDPVPAGFAGNTDIVTVDENKRPWNEGNPHWVGLSKPLFSKNNGLATIGNIITVRFDPMTMFQPHSHREGQEEVWTTVYGETYFLLGKEIRCQPTGTAYYIPPTGSTPHANFNVSDSMCKLFYFSTLQ